jgi:16S rRNA processing protein RimM
LGKIIRAHGIKGAVKVWPCTERPEHLERYTRFFLGGETADASMVEVSCLQARTSGNSVVMQLAGCSDRTIAESLVGRSLWMPAADLPPLEADAFYLHELMGKQAKTRDGRELGRVAGLLSGGPQEILVIRDGKQEYLIPAVRAFVVRIDAEVVVFDPPPGLLELNQGDSAGQ